MEVTIKSNIDEVIEKVKQLDSLLDQVLPKLEQLAQLEEKIIGLQPDLDIRINAEVKEYVKFDQEQAGELSKLIKEAQMNECCCKRA